MSERSPILFFVKAPVPGAVKSRLATALGADAAAGLYRCFVEDMLAMLDRSGRGTIVCCDPPGAVDAVAGWLGRDRNYVPQRGPDLGSRMEQAFRDAFSAGAEQAVLIGSDLPDLTEDIITGAFSALDRQGAVLGPAADGGYYLIGFRCDAFRPEVFRHMTWSLPDVFERTRERFRRTGDTVHVLAPWRDVDTLDDLRALYERGRGTVFDRSRTMHAVRSLPAASGALW